uniref:TPR_REGION domain-containing protein n=1 Tax=Echinostoma caproni TaxID=27848 RepID=A0A183AUU3_9TREM
LDAGDESAELYCALGDVTKNREYYWKAWEVSGERSARAMRSLAVVYMYVDKDYPKAIEYFDKSLQINNLQVSLWFTFGCCCLQAAEYAKAETAFRRCVTLDPEISADVGAFTDTIQACHRVIELRGKYNDDQVMGVLCKAVLDDVPDDRGRPASALRTKVLELFGRVTAVTPTNAEIWTHYANLLLGEKPRLKVVNYQRAIQNLQHAHRCRVQPTDIPWEQESKRRDAVVGGLQLLVQTLLNADSLLADPSTVNGSTEIVPAGTERSSLEETSQKAFIRSSLSTLRVTILSVMGHFKRVLESLTTSDAVVEVRKQQADLEELLSSIDTALGATA